MSNISKHYSLVTSTDVVEISKPILALGVNFFCFGRFYLDSSFTLLTSRPDWTEHLLSNKLHHTSTFEQHPELYDSGTVLWSCTEEDQARKDGREHFNICNGITLIEKHLHGCDMYHFGTTNCNVQLQHYLMCNFDVQYGYSEKIYSLL